MILPQLLNAAEALLTRSQSQKVASDWKLGDFSPSLMQPAMSQQFFPAVFCHCPAVWLHKTPGFLQCIIKKPVLIINTDHAIQHDGKVISVYMFMQ